MQPIWDHEEDIVSITFDEEAVEPSALRKAIEELGYDIEEIDAPHSTDRPAAIAKVAVPETAPAELREAFVRAGRRHRLVVVDFWATWCPPCVKLKKTTLANTSVKKLLERVELVYVDLDEEPALGVAWGVTSVPDVLFLAPDGRVVDRLKEYEEAETFGERLEAAIKAVEARNEQK